MKILFVILLTIGSINLVANDMEYLTLTQRIEILKRKVNKAEKEIASSKKRILRNQKEIASYIENRKEFENYVRRHKSVIDTFDMSAEKQQTEYNQDTKRYLVRRVEIYKKNLATNKNSYYKGYRTVEEFKISKEKNGKVVNDAKKAIRRIDKEEAERRRLIFEIQKARDYLRLPEIKAEINSLNDLIRANENIINKSVRTISKETGNSSIYKAAKKIGEKSGELVKCALLSVSNNEFLSCGKAYCKKMPRTDEEEIVKLFSNFKYPEHIGVKHKKCSEIALENKCRELQREIGQQKNIYSDANEAHRKT